MKRNSIKILYVEDDLNLGFVTKDNLNLAGYDVTHCDNGLDAAHEIMENEFDLCILDIMLPTIDGFELARRMRAKNIHIPILFLSAKSLPEDKIKGLKIGADDYITKPFSIEELLLKIKIFLKRSLVNSNSKEKEFHFSIGKYTFSYGDLQLKIGNQGTKLTIKEADLLQLFCSRKNEILKREEILNLIWGDDDYFLGRSLDVFISRLRNYLKEDNSIIIENIHGVGFRMVC